MSSRTGYEEREKLVLAPYAQLSLESRGRIHPETACDFRNCYYRDVGRIIHSMAFRFLEYKTQVFVNNEGDYYRTRLTHTLEVAQISRGVARILQLNEDLAECIALAHDLGHTPFGHNGEVAMNEMMADAGGFEHNMQSYRVVTLLEERYPHFKGLNLSYEVLEGIIKHTTDYDKPRAIDDFEDVGFPTIEAQIVNVADEIAFMNHDLDDGLHWGMITMDSLKEVPLWDETYRHVLAEYPDASPRIHRCRTISNLIDKLISDMQAETRRRIEARGIKTLADVRANGKDLVSFSDAMKPKTVEAKTFLFENMYYHPQLREMGERGSTMIRELFAYFMKHPQKMPEKFHDRFMADGSKRHICDYIAGMTDRYAVDMHKQFGTTRFD